MVKSDRTAFGIIFPNYYDELVPELVSERLMGSIPFAGRYRMIDFILSSMVNSGISRVSVLARKNYHSLMDHLGSGREWDLTRKNGGLTILPPYSEKGASVYNGRIEALASMLRFMTGVKEKYVIIADTNIAVNFDFNAFIDAHIESGADISVAYVKEEIPAGMKSTDVTLTKSMYYTYEIDDDGRVTKLHINCDKDGIANLGMNIYCVDREYLIELVRQSYVEGAVYLERDVLLKKIDEIKLYAYEYKGYHARISDMRSYFEENLKLLDDENLDALFEGGQIYTKLRDDNPTRYINGAIAKNTMAADGCLIEGEVENCVLFRGVKIGKGAKVKNCVLMQDTIVEPGAELEYVITDKVAVISENAKLSGTDSFPVYISKRQIV